MQKASDDWEEEDDWKKQDGVTKSFHSFIHSFSMCVSVNERDYRLHVCANIQPVYD